jgi:O-succinylbenzoate synthase
VADWQHSGPELRDRVAAALPGLRAFAIPMRTRFRGITVREGALIEGPAGWAEFSPFAEYGPRESSRWLACALEAAWDGWPAPVRDQVPVNVTVPAVGPEHAHRIVAGSGCRTAKVKVAERGQPEAADLARVEAVRDALGPGGRIRVDANGGWDVDTAARMLSELGRFGLEYAEQPCATLDELAALRRRVEVPGCGRGGHRDAEGSAAGRGGSRAADRRGVRAARRGVQRGGVLGGPGRRGGPRGGAAGPPVRLRPGHDEPADRRCYR